MEDCGILALFYARDEAALREAEAKYGAVCRAAAKNILGSDADAEECFSDALLRAWNAIPPEKPEHLRAYLLKLTRGVAIDRLRASGAAKRGGGELPLVLDELAEVLPGGHDVEDEALTRALGEAVSRFLKTLPQRDRIIFVRRCFMVESQKDIARSLGMRENSVAVTLRRTRLKLRAHLTKEGFLQ